MNKRMQLTLGTTLAAVLSAPALADGDAKTIEALEQRIEALQARIAKLEQRYRFVSFMPNYAERFQVMHLAGEAEDWAVASHELEELKRLTALATSADPEQGRLMQQMMAPSLEALEGAVGHGDLERFQEAVEQSVVTCNACHAATGSDFIQVSLDPRDSISLRHPHRLMAREVPGGHHHGAPGSSGGMTGGMMHRQAKEKPGHDDTGRPAHEHKE